MKRLFLMMVCAVLLMGISPASAGNLADEPLEIMTQNAVSPSVKAFAATQASPELLESAGPTHPEGLPKAGDMIAGGGNVKSAIDVGDIYIWKDCRNLYVEYVIVDSTPADLSDNWYITETHVEIAKRLALIPQANGTPIPGRFDYSMTHENVSQYTQIIPLNGSDTEGELFIAAHSVVCKGGVEGLANALPESVTVKWPYPGVSLEDRGSYFPGLIVSGDGGLNGTYAEGWCGNYDVNSIPYNNDYPASVYSSYYDEIPYEVVSRPENLDAVNWLLNHKDQYLGQPITLCPAPETRPSWWPSNKPYPPDPNVTINWIHIQAAIWYLIDDDLVYDPEDCWLDQQGAGYQIAQDALAYGKGFVPGCTDDVAVILAPKRGSGYWQSIILQTTLIELGVPCKSCETAWAANKTEIIVKGKNKTIYAFQFPGKNWAAYLKLTPYNACYPTE